MNTDRKLFGFEMLFDNARLNLWKEMVLMAASVYSAAVMLHSRDIVNNAQAEYTSCVGIVPKILFYVVWIVFRKNRRTGKLWEHCKKFLYIINIMIVHHIELELVQNMRGQQAISINKYVHKTEPHIYFRESIPEPGSETLMIKCDSSRYIHICSQG